MKSNQLFALFTNLSFALWTGLTGTHTVTVTAFHTNTDIDPTIIQKAFDHAGNMFKQNAINQNNLIKQQQHSRLLQLTEPVFDPPNRTCQQNIINVATPTQLQQAATSFINTIFPPQVEPTMNQAAMAAILPSIQFGLRARIVCSSCREIIKLYKYKRFWRDRSQNGFQRYCGRRSFGRRVTHSSLLLEPLDPETMKPIVGIVKQHLYMKPLNTAQQGTPSESWPTDIDSFNSPTAFLDHFDAWLPMIIGSTGVIVVAPDYFGYGQTFKIPKMIFIKRTYQQVAAVSFLKSQKLVESSRRTFFAKELSTSGFSEGGYAVVAASLALDRLGSTILTVNSGGAPYHIGRQISFGVSAVDNGTASLLSHASIPLVGSSYSSVNPNLPNSNVGQDFISEAWQIEDDYTRNALEWASSDQSLGNLDLLLPDDPNELINEAFLSRVRDLISQGIMDPCVNAVKGVDDLLCKAIEQNTLIDEVESTKFPISICHSPDDEAIPIINAPNVTLNDNLSTATVFGFPASGDHFASIIFCFVSTILGFTSFAPEGLDLNGIIFLGKQ